MCSAADSVMPSGQSPLYPPSSAPIEKVEGDSQTPFLYLLPSPLPIQVRKCTVQLERMEFLDETKEAVTFTTSQTEGLHQDDEQGASASHNSEEEKDFDNLTDSPCKGDKSEASDSSSSHSGRRCVGLSPKKKREDQLSNNKATDSIPHTRPTEHPQQEHRESAASTHHQEVTSITSDVTTVTFSETQNPKELDSCSSHSSRKHKGHLRGRKGQLTRLQQGTGTVNISSDSSSNSQRQHPRKMQHGLKKQRRRKRRGYCPGTEEEEEEDEPIFRKVHSNHIYSLNASHRGKRRDQASPRYQGPLVQGPVRNASPQSEEAFPSSEDSHPTSRQKENSSTAKNQIRSHTSSKEAEENQTLHLVSLDTSSSSDPGKENIIFHKRGPTHVYPPERPGRDGISANNQDERQATTKNKEKKQTQASSFCSGPSNSPPPSTSQRRQSSWLASLISSSASSTSTKTTTNNCLLRRSPCRLASERKSSHHQHSSTPSGKEVEGDSQTPFLYLPPSLLAQVRKCAVQLERIEFSNETKEAGTSNTSQTEGPHQDDRQGASASHNSEEKQDLYDLTGSPGKGDKSQSSDSSSSHSGRRCVGLSAIKREDQLKNNKAADSIPHTRPTVHPQQEARESAASTRHQMTCNASDAITVSFSEACSPKELDSCSSHSSRKLKGHLRGRKGQLARLQQGTGTVSISSDSSSSSQSHHAREMQHRRKRRGCCPGIEEQEEEEESIFRKVHSNHICSHNASHRGKRRGLASQRYQGPLVQGPVRSAFLQSEETFSSSEDSDPSSRQKENPITSKNQIRSHTSKEAEENQTLHLVLLDTSSSSETETENIIFHKRGPTHVYPPERPGRDGISAKNQDERQATTKNKLKKQTQASSFCPGPSNSPPPSTSQRRQSSRLASLISSASSTSTKTTTNNCPLRRSPCGLVSERKGNYRLDEDLDILEYIVKQQAFDRVRGRAFWQEMERDFSHRRTWQSLKERFRTRIMTNLRAYVPHGLDPNVTELLKGKLCLKKGSRRRAGRNEFTFDEDLVILRFISENHRYKDVGGVLLWQNMESKCDQLCNHTWSSIKTRFMKKIRPNIDVYGLTEEEVLQFKNKRRLKELKRKKEEESRKLPNYITKRKFLRLSPRRKTAAASASQLKEDSPSSAITRHNTYRVGHQESSDAESSDMGESQRESSVGSSFAMNSPPPPTNHRNKTANQIHKKQLTPENTMNQKRPNKLPATKKSCPVDSDLLPPITPPLESCQAPPKPHGKRPLLTNDVIEWSPKTPFSKDSINRTLMYRRKKQLNRAVDETKKKQGSRSVTEEEEEESSQDEPPTKRGQMAHRAEVHKERLEEGVIQRIINTKGEHPLLITSKTEDEEEEETEEMLVPEEIIEETEEEKEVMALEKERAVAGKLSQEGEIISEEEEMSSGEEELEVHIYMDMPENTHTSGLDKKMGTGRERVPEKTHEQEEAPKESSVPSAEENTTAETNIPLAEDIVVLEEEEEEDSLPDINSTSLNKPLAEGERRREEDNQENEAVERGQHNEQQQQQQQYQQPDCRSPLPSLRIIASHTPLQNPQIITPTTHHVSPLNIPSAHHPTAQVTLTTCHPSLHAIPITQHPSLQATSLTQHPIAQITPTLLHSNCQVMPTHHPSPHTTSPTHHPSYQVSPTTHHPSPHTTSPTHHPSYQVSPTTHHPSPQKTSTTLQYSPLHASLPSQHTEPHTKHPTPHTTPSISHHSPCTSPTIHPHTPQHRPHSPVMPLPQVTHHTHPQCPLIIKPPHHSPRVGTSPIHHSHTHATHPPHYHCPLHAPPPTSTTYPANHHSRVVTPPKDTTQTQHNSPSTLQPGPPRRISTVAHILESSSGTSDTTMDVVCLSSRGQHTPEPRRRDWWDGKDGHLSTSTNTLRNKLRKHVIRK